MRLCNDLLHISRKWLHRCGIRPFQKMQQILDVTGDEAVLGKPTKSDEKNHKITYVSVKGLDQARKDVERYSKEAVRLLEELPCENEFLHELILNLISRDA